MKSIAIKKISSYLSRINCWSVPVWFSYSWVVDVTRHIHIVSDHVITSILLCTISVTTAPPTTQATTSSVPPGNPPLPFMLFSVILKHAWCWFAKNSWKAEVFCVTITSVFRLFELFIKIFSNLRYHLKWELNTTSYVAWYYKPLKFLCMYSTISANVSSNNCMGLSCIPYVLLYDL